MAEELTKEELTHQIDESIKRLETVDLIENVLIQWPRNTKVENIARIYEQMPDKKVREILPGMREQVKKLVAQRHRLLMELKKVAPEQIVRVPITSISQIYRVLPPVYHRIEAIMRYFLKVEPAKPPTEKELIDKVVETYGEIREAVVDALDDLYRMGIFMKENERVVSVL